MVRKKKLFLSLAVCTFCLMEEVRRRIDQRGTSLLICWLCFQGSRKFRWIYRWSGWCVFQLSHRKNLPGQIFNESEQMGRVMICILDFSTKGRHKCDGANVLLHSNDSIIISFEACHIVGVLDEELFFGTQRVRTVKGIGAHSIVPKNRKAHSCWLKPSVPCKTMQGPDRHWLTS